MLDAFRLKPFDLEPVLASWTDAPKFDGNPKKDLPVDEWLEKIKAGCIERKVPEECWHKVAQHFMGPNARARLDELKAVVAQVNGGKYRWNWQKFKVAMESMGWEIDTKRTETIKVSKGGSWWRMKKKESVQEESTTAPAPAPVQAAPAERPTPHRSGSSFWSIKSSSSKGEDAHLPPIPPAYCEEPASIEEVVEPTKSSMTKRVLQRSATDTFWPMKKKDVVEECTDTKGKGVVKMPSESNLQQASVEVAKAPARAPSRSVTTDAAAVAVPASETKAPLWLLNACNALEFITSEHPKAMSIISAILITAGSIPAIPAISAGAGGAVLASGAAHAIGAIAVGLGQAIGTTVKNSQKAEAPASSSTR